ncbi:MAG: PadR family transcriptional regulator [Candidatus Binataceae bacterium]
MPTIRHHAERQDRQLYAGLIRLHILHHASEEPIFGFGIIEELARHGYKLSGGSLYPILHGMERKGYLRSVEERSGKWARRVYRATPLGRAVLADAREKVIELFGELFEDKASSRSRKSLRRG